MDLRLNRAGGAASSGACQLHWGRGPGFCRTCVTLCDPTGTWVLWAERRDAQTLNRMENTSQPPIDLTAVKSKQQAAWSTGDYAVVGTTLQIVGETLCEALDLRAGASVLDVAAGNGNATLAAARRWCDVTSTDYVASLLESRREARGSRGPRHPLPGGRCRAPAVPGRRVRVVLSTFGVMFTPDQEQAAEELARVCKPGGRIGLANWTPESFIGQLFKTIGKYVPPAAGREVPGALGNERASRGAVRREREGHPHHAARVRVSLSLADALDRGVPHLLRADEQDVREPRRRTGRLRSRAICSRCSNGQSLARSFTRAAERVPRSRDRKAMSARMSEATFSVVEFPSEGATFAAGSTFVRAASGRRRSSSWPTGSRRRSAA